MNVTPCCAHSVASSGFSDRKPQPGCSAEQRGLHRGLDDALDVEIALRRAAGTEHDDLAAARVRRVAIGLADGEHRHDAAAHRTRARRGRRPRRGSRSAGGGTARRALDASSLSMQASTLETSNLPGASMSTDFTTPSSIDEQAAARSACPCRPSSRSSSMPSAFENAAAAVGEHDDLAERVVLLRPRLHDPRVVDRQARDDVDALAP